jgi:hypothetical protein
VRNRLPAHHFGVEWDDEFMDGHPYTHEPHIGWPPRRRARGSQLARPCGASCPGRRTVQPSWQVCSGSRADVRR